MESCRLGNVMVDCADAAALHTFYTALLGWAACEVHDLPGVRSPEGVVFLFAQEEDYVPPVWPEAAGSQQKQMHFDFQVLDMAQGMALGARLTAEQFAAMIS